MEAVSKMVGDEQTIMGAIISEHETYNCNVRFAEIVVCSSSKKRRCPGQTNRNRVEIGSRQQALLWAIII